LWFDLFSAVRGGPPWTRFWAEHCHASTRGGHISTLVKSRKWQLLFVFRRSAGHLNFVGAREVWGPTSASFCSAACGRRPTRTDPVRFDSEDRSGCPGGPETERLPTYTCSQQVSRPAIPHKLTRSPFHHVSHCHALTHQRDPSSGRSGHDVERFGGSPAARGWFAFRANSQHAQVTTHGDLCVSRSRVPW
jgi:hypothetical protein